MMEAALAKCSFIVFGFRVSKMKNGVVFFDIHFHIDW